METVEMLRKIEKQHKQERKTLPFHERYDGTLFDKKVKSGLDICLVLTKPSPERKWKILRFLRFCMLFCIFKVMYGKISIASFIY